MTSGLTLIEILVVVAIAALIIGVLLYYMFPSDDRRCRIEAERLSAYVTAAWAEAVMRDGAARVVLDFNDHTGKREVTRQGADITRDLWEDDKKGGVHQVQKPVVIDTVATESVPTLQAGTGYLMFNGRRSEGGVVVLRLDEALYSVLIPQTGEVKIQRGRATMPGSNQFQRPKLPDLMGYKSKGGKSSTSGFPSGGLPPSQPITRRPATRRPRSRSRAKSAKNVKKATPRSDDFSPTPDDYRPGSPDYPLPPKINPGFQPTPSPTPATPKPQVPNVPTTPGTGTGGGGGGPAVVGRSYLLQSVEIDEPVQLKGVLESLLGDLIANGQMNLLLNVAAQTAERHYLVQAVRSGTRAAQGDQGESVELANYRQSDNFPTYRGESRPVAYGGGASIVTFRPEAEDNALILYIRDKRIDEESQACKYQPLKLIDVTVSLTATLLDDTKTITVQGSLRPSAARNFEVKTNEVLEETLESYGVGFNTDTVNDGVDDSWQFIFSGNATRVSFGDDPTSREEVVPENCEADTP